MYNYSHGAVILGEDEKRMQAEGYRFVTNFSVENESFYQSAAEKCGIDYIFGTKVYDSEGICYDSEGKGSKAFYVKRGINTCEFWKVFDNLKERYINP